MFPENRVIDCKLSRPKRKKIKLNKGLYIFIDSLGLRLGLELVTVSFATCITLPPTIPPHFVDEFSISAQSDF